MEEDCLRCSQTSYHRGGYRTEQNSTERASLRFRPNGPTSEMHLTDIESVIDLPSNQRIGVGKGRHWKKSTGVRNIHEAQVLWIRHTETRNFFVERNRWGFYARNETTRKTTNNLAKRGQGLSLVEAVRAAKDRSQWRKTVHDAAKPWSWIKNGWSTTQHKGIKKSVGVKSRVRECHRLTIKLTNRCWKRQTLIEVYWSPKHST